jgi:hypothetical protein
MRSGDVVTRGDRSLILLNIIKYLEYLEYLEYILTLNSIKFLYNSDILFFRN